MPHIYDEDLIPKIAHLIKMRADGRAPTELADGILGIVDLTDLFVASTPRRVIDVGVPASAVSAGDLWGNFQIGSPVAANTIHALMIGNNIGGAARIDVVRVSLQGNAVFPSGTVLDILESDDNVGGGLLLTNIITQSQTPPGNVSALLLTSTPANPDLLPGPYGTNVVRLNKLLIGPLAANTPFTSPGDVVASAAPPTPAGGIRRILLSLQAAGVALGQTSVSWSVLVRVVPS